MSSTAQSQIVEVLRDVVGMNLDYRFGQLLANVQALSADQTDASLYDISDDDLLAVLKRHRDSLQRLSATVAASRELKAK